MNKFLLNIFITGILLAIASYILVLDNEAWRNGYGSFLQFISGLYITVHLILQIVEKYK